MFLEVFLACLLALLVVSAGVWTVVTFTERNLVSGRIVHLCPVHGRSCAGCEAVLLQLEEFVAAQGIDNLYQFERVELERLRVLVAAQRLRRDEA